MSGQFRFSKLLILLSLSLLFFSLKGYSQDLYWINGSGSWDDPSHWSAESGGEPAHVIPTRHDNVIFDENSFSKAGQYVRIKGETECNNLIWKTTSYQPVIESRSFIFKKVTDAKLNIYGSVVIEEEVQNEFYGDIQLKSGQKDNTLNISPELHSDVIFNGANGEWILEQELKTQGNIHLKQGELNTNDQNVTSDEFVGSGDRERALTLGSSEIIVNKWDFEKSEKLAFDSQQSTIFLSGGNVSRDFKPGYLSYNRITSYKTKDTESDVELTAYTDSVSCYGGNDGVIYMLASGGSGEYIYRVKDGDGSILNEMNTSSDSVAFTGFSAQTYHLELEDANDENNYVYTSRTIDEPDPLVIDSIECIQALSCYDSEDAALKAYASGGTEPYVEYTWKINDSVVGSDSSVVTSIKRNDLVEVKVKDAKGCESDWTNTRFHEDFYGDSIPSEIEITVENVIASCALNDDGEIELSASGGTGDKDFRLVSTATDDTIPDPTAWDEDGYFTDLAPDTYETFAIDENGCLQQGDDVSVDSITQTQIINDPVDNVACEGTAANFNVDVEGVNLQYTWQYSSDGSSWSDLSGSNISGEETDALSIDPVSNSDELFYRVYVTGDCGEEYSDTVSLTVQDTVTINSHPADETVCEGEEASFSVSADGEGTLTYQWYTNASGSWETISGAENDNYQIPEV
ncbi:MAG: hypothetical protein R6U04_10130, partial [Bacteroidales bacterium]